MQVYAVVRENLVDRSRFQPPGQSTSVDDAGNPIEIEEKDGAPVREWGSDEEVGDFCAYLCTTAASWIQGQSINHDGGRVMTH